METLTRDSKKNQYEVVETGIGDEMLWDNYVDGKDNSTLYHLFSWKWIIEKTYHHKTFFLAAYLSSGKDMQPGGPSPAEEKSSEGAQVGATRKICGVLPLVLMKHFYFGNRLCSLPFFDTGGVLADNEDAAKALMEKAIAMAHDVKANFIDMRFSEYAQDSSHVARQAAAAVCPEQSEADCQSLMPEKVRLVLELPDASKTLYASFKSKLRSQINRPRKAGLTVQIGGKELIDPFYDVFSINMRDLGSPVHSKKIFQNVLKYHEHKAKIFMVYKDNMPVAGSVIIGFKDQVENPWASALREYSRMSPNMLLYWSMLEFACDNGYKYFNFGRSTVGEGTFRFKSQWGAKPLPLHWQRFVFNQETEKQSSPSKMEFEKAINLWKKIPVPVTKVIGPMIRKHIEL